jgi:peptide/nickel transport system substrate-binding protein
LKRLIIPIAILLVCVFVITACSSSTPTTVAPVTSNPPTSQATTSAPATSAPPTSAPATSKPGATTTPAASIPAVTQTPSSGIKTYGGTLRLIQPNSPATPIGWPADAGAEALREMQLSIETLLRGELDGTMSPSLVQSFEINSDPANASFTLHLRKGIKFHDGTDFNAQAVKWNWEQTKAGAANAGTTIFWKSFEIIDDYNIKINFTTWQNRLTTGFGMASMNMVSPTAFQKNGVDWMRVHMVGTGPFIQTDYQRDVTVKTVKNKDYWDTGKPYLDGVQYFFVADQLTRLALFKSGGADAVDLNSNGRDANDLKALGYNILTQQTGTDVLVPDSINADSPWSNAKVRQAAEYAIDKVALNNAFGYGYNGVAYQICSTSESVYDPNFAGERKYDVAKAKQLLSEAGYPNGFKTRIISAVTGNRDKIIAIQSMLSKVNINCDLEFAEAGQMNAYTLAGAGWKNALVSGYIFEWPNMNYGLNLWFGVPSAWYPSLKKPDGWKEALGASLATKDPDPTIIKKLIRTFYDDATVITLDYPAQLTAVTNNVKDSGIYTRIQNYYWRPQEAWLAK